MCGNPNTRLLVRLIIDVVLLIVVHVMAFIALPYWLKRNSPAETQPFEGQHVMATPFKQTRRGFFCLDESLSYPYKAETLLNKVHLTILTVALPAAVIIIVEMLRAAFKKSQDAAEITEYSFVGLRIPTFISECYQLMGAYLFGLGLLRIALLLLKHWTGRLRPYFFDVCQPQMPDNSSCDDEENFGVYIENYTCSELATVSTDLFATLRQSFPSSYVTCTAYVLAFLIFYLQARLRAGWLRLLRMILQFVAAVMVALVAMERFSSMRNHWTDVGAGIILGLIFAAFIAFAVLQLSFQHIAERRTTVSRKINSKYF